MTQSLGNKMGFKKIVMFLLFPLVAACGPIIEFPGSGDAPRHFQLSPTATVAQTSLATENDIISIYLENVTTSGVLKTTNILVQSGENELQYYQDALWVDRTPILVGRFLTEALEADRYIRIISNDNIEIPVQYRLKTDLREFHVSLGGRGRSRNVKINLSVMLVKNGPVEIIAMKNFEINQAVGSENIEDVVKGFNVGLDQLAQDILSWTHTSLENG